jgi:RNA polymerase sigma-70 factor (ECF subfamily)
MNGTEINSVLARVLRGEIDAYEIIIRAYQREVWQVVTAMLFDTRAAEDLVQRSFISAYQHLHQYQPGRDFGAWLKEIARNHVRQELRRASREDIRLELYRNQVIQSSETTSGLSTEEALQEALRQCTEKLPPGSAKLVELRYALGRNFGEIATAIGRTLEATRQHLARIRLHLRECIEKKLAQL